MLSLSAHEFRLGALSKMGSSSALGGAREPHQHVAEGDAFSEVHTHRPPGIFAQALHPNRLGLGDS
jgi:hypothetical protein